MDAPWYWSYGVLCVEQGQNYDINLSGSAMPSDVDSVKAAAYWYDYRHETAGTVANVNIYLRSGTGANDTLRSNVDAYDNKAFVYHDDWPDAPVYFRVQGHSVVNGHHDPGCSGSAPNNKIRVYYVVFAEDSDRESPTFDPLSGEGIFPEGL